MPIFTKLLAERKVERTPILEDQALPEGDPTIRPRFLEEPMEAAAERMLRGLETRGKRREQSCLHR